MVKDFDKFAENHRKSITGYKDAKELIFEAKRSIQPIIDSSHAVMFAKYQEMVADFKAFMKNRSLEDFTDKSFCEIVYGVGESKELFISDWLNILNASFSDDESFLEISERWSGKVSERHHLGAPVWQLSQDTFLRVRNGNSFDAAFDNVAKCLSGIFDRCEEMSPGYSMIITCDLAAPDDWLLSKEGDNWVVTWTDRKLSDDDWNWDETPMSHMESTVDGVLDWIVENVWKVARNRKAECGEND